MTVFYVDANMRKGKTAFAVFHCFRFNKYHPRGKIYANFHFKPNGVKNTIYTPYMILPFSELEKSGYALIIFDDFASLDMLKRFGKLIASVSGKLQLTLIFTIQYYTMLTRAIRFMSQYQVDVQYNDQIDKLSVYMLTLNEQPIKFNIREPSKYIFPYYDTTETVLNPTDDDIVKEIIKFSETTSDLQRNIAMFYPISKRRKLFNQIVKNSEKEFEYDKDILDWLKI